MKRQDSEEITRLCVPQIASAEAVREHLLAKHSGQPVPEPPGTVTLTINGQVYKQQVQPEWTLYELIHDRMGLTGAKMFCDRGACGSCTVIMDGRPILSCMTLAIECDGKTIETVEGIAAAEPSPHRDLREAPLHAVRLLHPGLRGHRKGAARQESRPHGRGDKGGPRGQPLPVRHLPPAPQGRAEAAKMPSEERAP